jgi:hypothetical protein
LIEYLDFLKVARSISVTFLKRLRHDVTDATNRTIIQKGGMERIPISTASSGAGQYALILSITIPTVPMPLKLVAITSG